MSDVTDPPVQAPAEPSFAERWVADFRLLAVLCARTYGSIAIVSLIALNALAWALTRSDSFVIGAAAGVGAAFAAYVNFSAVAANGSDRLVNASMVAAIVWGVAAALIFVAAAF